MILLDGTVIPSYMGVESSGQSTPRNAFDNISLRQGEVLSITYPTDPKSVTKKFLEYNVSVQYQDGAGPAINMLYPNCLASNPLAGEGDSLKVTYRPRTQAPQQGDKKTIGNGAKVLVLCVNGSIRRGYIIGGINDAGAPVENQADGHNLKFEFNGIRFTIDKEGQAIMTFRGATNHDGTLASTAVPAAEGTSVSFDREGNVKVATPNDAQYIKIDHQNRKIEVVADTAWNTTVNGTTDLTSQNDMSILISDGEFNLGASGHVNINSLGVLVGTATDAWVKGTTYRNAQTQLHSQLASTLGVLAGQITAAGTSLATAAGLNVVPIIGGILAAAPFAAAAATLISAGPGFALMATDIVQFEAGGLGYLSIKNKTD